MAEDEEIARYNNDSNLFDSNKGTNFRVYADIVKNYSGNPRPNGVIQYILTYYNKHGQESGSAWVSDLIYLAPSGSGGSPEGNNTCQIELTFHNLDASFTNYRLYSLVRTSKDGTLTSYIVNEGKISDQVIIIDDGANQTAEDASRLMYLGSQPVIAGTLTHKDQTLFLGDLKSAGRGSFYDDMEKAISALRQSGCMSFVHSDGTNGDDIVLPNEDELYPYINQLQFSSSQITTYKGGEKYRFALTFRFADGTSTDAFWLGDVINHLYPEIDANGNVAHRVIAKCVLPNGAGRLDNIFEVLSNHPEANITGIQLMVAEATYADRSVKAQGILCPTVFNVWERYNNRLYSQASWIMRPRNSGFACRHFEPIHNSIGSDGEIDCNYWSVGNPTPYYQLKDYNLANPAYNEEFDGEVKFDYMMTIYHVYQSWDIFHGGKYFWAQVLVVKAELLSSSASASAAVEGYDFSNSTQFTSLLAKLGQYGRNGAIETSGSFVDSANEYFMMKCYLSRVYSGESHGVASQENLWGKIYKYLNDTHNLKPGDIVTEQTFKSWCNAVDADDNNPYYNIKKPNGYSSYVNALDDAGGNKDASRWITPDRSGWNSYDYTPSYYKKHLMFVDENVVTLNSPEIETETVSFDKAGGHKLRIIGVAKITSSQSDYTVDAIPGKYPGENLVSDSFNSIYGSGNLNGLISWPLWAEYGLFPKPNEGEYTFPENPEDRSSDDYEWGSQKNYYWLHMWNRSGKINGFTDAENHDYSNLNSKVWANLRVAARTIYNPNSNCIYPIGDSDLRVFNFISGQYMGLDINGDTKYYDANIKSSLMPPGEHKYPILYSNGRADTAAERIEGTYDMMSNMSVMMEYRSTPHAVIALGTRESGGYYYQKTLPSFTGKDNNMPYVLPEKNTTTHVTGPLLPWIENNGGTGDYPYIDYQPDPANPTFTLGDGDPQITQGDKYVFIGEIYKDFTGNEYGGTSESAIQNNIFIPAGPIMDINQIRSSRTLYGTQGDTYFQRWDCLKTKPYKEFTNGVIDITSVMLETHVNIDGRYDLQRGISQLASIDCENFDSINPVYSQRDNFFKRRDLDEDFNYDSYRSSITWTLEKADLAEIDEWTHLTLASSLKLDGDRGICRALRRMQNSIIAFQDKGISEILFNSRTQLSTTDGVPVELANSGKVDGKRYVTNKYGCINKWSIVEGKTGLYFIDNINKAFCLFSGNAVDSLSDKLGFGVWFKDVNKIEPWMPKDFKNIVSFYDREHSDIYLIKDSDDEMPCLVYNENLQAFTSFFDYNAVPMITNVRDRLVSYRDGKLWLQNEGLYCNFFGSQYDFWVQYRVTPEPFSDKIWTNFDYRADFYHILDGDGKSVVPEEYLINGDRYLEMNDLYKENETFTDYRAWNEYQDTGRINILGSMKKMDLVRKKFRIWRIAISRAIKEGTNVRGLDRIRNPWMNLLFRKDMSNDNNQYLMQLHDIVVKYFE